MFIIALLVKKNRNIGMLINNIENALSGKSEKGERRNVGQD